MSPTVNVIADGTEQTFGEYHCKYFYLMSNFISWLKTINDQVGNTWYAVYQTYLVQRGLPANYLEQNVILTSQAVATWNTNILGIYYDIPENWAIIPVNVPTPEYGYICSICGARFNTNEELLAHTAQVHSTPPVGYTCPICGAVFETDAELQIHKQIHTPIPQPTPTPTPGPGTGAGISMTTAGATLIGVALLLLYGQRKKRK